LRIGEINASPRAIVNRGAALAIAVGARLL
jgi:hypothetical protein